MVAISAVTVAPDGRVWWAGAPFNGGDPSYGLAVNVPPSQRFDYLSPASFGMNDNVRDMVALPDGRLALAGDHTGLWLLTPSTLAVARVAVDIALAHLDRPFDYLVPERLAEDAAR